MRGGNLDRRRHSPGKGSGKHREERGRGRCVNLENGRTYGNMRRLIRGGNSNIRPSNGKLMRLPPVHGKCGARRLRRKRGEGGQGKGLRPQDWGTTSRIVIGSIKDYGPTSEILPITTSGCKGGNSIPFTCSKSP